MFGGAFFRQTKSVSFPTLQSMKHEPKDSLLVAEKKNTITQALSTFTSNSY
jgi:hypothetical protein